MRDDIKGVLFDCNETLANTETLWFETWREVYASYGQVLTRQHWRKNLQRRWGIPISQQLCADLKRAGISLSNSERLNIVRHAKRRAEELRPQHAVRKDVAEVAVDALDKGKLVGVVSNSPADYVDHFIPDVLRGHFERYPELIITADTLGVRPKPSPTGYRTGTNRMGLRPFEVVALDDTPKGVKAAARAGVFSVAVPTEWNKENLFHVYDVKAEPLGTLDEILETLPTVPLAHRALTRVSTSAEGVGL